MKNVGRLRRAFQREARQHTPITIRWEDRSGGTVDPVTSAVSAGEAVARSATVYAVVHYVGPSASGYRAFAEIQTGDAIIDFPISIYRVTDAGDTDLFDGQVLDELQFAKANRELDRGEIEALAEEIDISTLTNALIEIDGENWAQQRVGNNLAKSWDARVRGKKVVQSILVRKCV